MCILVYVHIREGAGGSGCGVHAYVWHAYWNGWIVDHITNISFVIPIDDHKDLEEEE